MKICRFNDNRLGLVEGDQIVDVTGALDAIPPMHYPAPLGDQLIANLDAVLARATALKAGAPRLPVASVKLLPPVAGSSQERGRGVSQRCGN